MARGTTPWPLGRVLLLRFVFVVPFGGCLLASWLGCARLVTSPLAYALAMIVGATISLFAGVLVAVAVDEMIFHER